MVFDDAYNLNNEYTWSNIDQRHQFAANAPVLPAEADRTVDNGARQLRTAVQRARPART